MTQQDIARIVQLFNERAAHWTSEGYYGAALYERLAFDSALPPNFPPRAVAAILNVELPAVAARRQRGLPPSFIRTASNATIYPRDSFCHFLRDRFVERHPRSAQGEYTNTAA